MKSFQDRIEESIIQVVKANKKEPIAQRDYSNILTVYCVGTTQANNLKTYLTIHLNFQSHYFTGTIKTVGLAWERKIDVWMTQYTEESKIKKIMENINALLDEKS